MTVKAAEVDKEGERARYKPYDVKQDRFIPLSFADQILPGSFEHLLNELVEEHELDLSVFEQRYRNDETGYRAYDPKVLLKSVLYGYDKGMISSRRLEEAGRRKVVFMALAADARPHFTTIAACVSEMEKEIIELFRDVLLICEELELIGKEHFAVDGCKLPSNASKQWSGTHEELKEKQKKFEGVAEEIVRRHRERDESEAKGAMVEQEEKKRKTYREKIKQIKEFLAKGEKKSGPSGNEQKSNITDPDSAKMSTSRGVMQGFNGVAMGDDKPQIVVQAEVWGAGQEAPLLAPMIEGTREHVRAIESTADVCEKAKLTADSGLHRERSLAEVETSGVDAYIADPQYRKRDEAFAHAARHKERHRKEERQRTGYAERKRCGNEDFLYDEEEQTCRCPAGHKLYRSGREMEIDGCEVARFKAPKSACRQCLLRNQCLRHPERTVQRQVQFFKGRSPQAPERVIEAMRRKFDSPGGRSIYSKRIGTIEPVFGNIVENKGMHHFTLRSRRKVGIQWKLYNMVHNIEKIAHSGKAA